MKITRNGIEIKLTWQEMREVYEIMSRNYIQEDIISKAEDMAVELSEEDVESIANIVESGLEHNDSYWESYWLTIEYAIDNHKKGGV